MGKMWLGVVLSPIQLKRWIWQPDEGSYSQQLSDFVVSLWSLVLGCENVLDFHRRVLRSQGCLISFVSVGWDPSEFLWSSSPRFHPFWTLILLLHWIFEHGFLNRPIFQFLHVCNQYISLSTLLPRPMRVRGMFLARPSYLIGGASTGLMKKSDDVQPLLRTEWSILQNGSPNRLSKGFLSRRIRGLGRFADINSIPWNQPTIFHPSLIATTLQMFLPFFCALLLRQSHSSQIDEV